MSESDDLDRALKEESIAQEAPESSSESSSDTDSESSLGSESDSDGELELAGSDTESSGIPHTKNEVLEVTIPRIPSDLKLDETTPVALIGHVHAVGNASVIVKATGSARYRVLTDDAVLVLGGPGEKKQPIGVLFETFGPVDQPFYVVKFEDAEDISRYNEHKDSEVFQVVSTGEYKLTAEFKLKGTDASNFNDEEVPLEEQEFSDDEEESRAKMKTKKRKRRPKAGKEVGEESRSAPGAIPSTTSAPPAKAQFKPAAMQFVPTSVPQTMPQTVPQTMPQSMPAAMPPMQAMPMMPMMPPELAQQWYQFQQFQMSQYKHQPPPPPPPPY